MMQRVRFKNLSAFGLSLGLALSLATPLSAQQLLGIGASSLMLPDVSLTMPQARSNRAWHLPRFQLNLDGEPDYIVVRSRTDESVSYNLVAFVDSVLRSELRHYLVPEDALVVARDFRNLRRAEEHGMFLPSHEVTSLFNGTSNRYYIDHEPAGKQQEDGDDFQETEESETEDSLADGPLIAATGLYHGRDRGLYIGTNGNLHSTSLREILSPAPGSVFQAGGSIAFDLNNFGLGNAILYHGVFHFCENTHGRFAGKLCYGLQGIIDRSGRADEQVILGVLSFDGD